MKNIFSLFFNFNFSFYESYLDGRTQKKSQGPKLNSSLIERFGVGWKAYIGENLFFTKLQGFKNVILYISLPVTDRF